MAIHPLESTIEDGNLSAWLHGKLTVDGDLVLNTGDLTLSAGDLKLVGNFEVMPTAGNAQVKLITPTGNDWSFGANTSSNVFYIYDVSNSTNRFLITNSGLIGFGIGVNTPTVDVAIGDPNTGINHVAEDSIAIVAGGVEALRLSETAGAIAVQGGVIDAVNGIAGLNASGKVPDANLESPVATHNSDSTAHNNASYDTITQDGAISLTTKMTYIDTISEGEGTHTLADGVVGQEKFIILQGKIMQDGIVTPANLWNGTTITFNTNGETIHLIFMSGKWAVVGGTAAVT